ncbi:MAG: phosphatase PAP2 family protein [Candidatus Thorarchaeota archaeon]
MNDLLFGNFGKDIIIFLQSFSPLFDIPFIIISLLGSAYFYITVLALIYWTVSKKTGLRLFYLLFITSYINILIKGIFGIIRPYQAYPNEIKPIVTEPGYSFPSSHAQTAGTFWGYVGSSYKSNSYVIILSIIIISLISISRVYLGVHYPSDVIVGIVIGLIVLVVSLYSLPWIEKYFSLKSDKFIIFSALIISIGFVVMFVLVVVITNHDIKVADPGDFSGAIFGGVLGIIIERKYINFPIKEVTNFQKFMRLFFGYLIISLGLPLKDIFDYVFITGYSIVLSNYILFALLAFATTAFVPWVFMKFENIGESKS